MKRRPELRKHASLVIGAGLICALASLALLAPWIAPHHPVLDADLMSAAEPPSGAFPLGTDAQGRDILSRILYGARISLTIGLVSQIINTLIGVTLGVSAGYFGGWWDDLVNGLTNLMLGIPSLIFALAIMAVLGPGVPSLLLALGLTNWSYTCRIARSQTLTIRSLAYAEAARAIGCGNARIMAGAHSAEHAGTSHRHGDARHGFGRLGGSVALLSRPWRPGAATKLGLDVVRGSRSTACGALDIRLSRYCDFRLRPGLQPPG